MKLSLPGYMYQNFDFLVDLYGFQCVLSSPTKVVYESHKVRVAILYDNRHSHELSVDFSIRDVTSGDFKCIGDLRSVESMNKNLKRDVVFPIQASTPHALELSVAFLGAYLKDYCGDLLCGNETAFARFKEYLLEEGLKYNLKMTLESMRRAANLAWGRHDYKALKQILEEHREYLTPSEKLKLNFACKKLLGPRDM